MSIISSVVMPRCHHLLRVLLEEPFPVRNRARGLSWDVSGSRMYVNSILMHMTQTSTKSLGSKAYKTSRFRALG